MISKIFLNQAGILAAPLILDNIYRVRTSKIGYNIVNSTPQLQTNYKSP